MEWLDVHAGSVQAFATLVLVIITAYYAWTSRAQAKAARAALQANARQTLQSRLDRISEIMITQPGLFDALDDPNVSGDEQDERFHLANIFVAIFEEAYMQRYIEHSMPDDEWRAWQTTFDSVMSRRYLRGYWRHTQGGYGSAFARWADERLAMLTS